MKKLTIIVACAAFFVLAAAPAMAADAKFSGMYRVTMFSDSNQQLKDSDASYTHQNSLFRLQTTYMVNKNLSVTTQFDVNDDKPWGRSNEIAPAYSSSEVKWNLEWDRAYMNIITSWGDVEVGYNGSGDWGPRFMNHSIDTNRIRVRTKLGNLQLVGLYEKYFEGDAGVTISDGDADAWSVGGIFKAGAMEFGALYTLQVDKSGNSTSANNLANKASDEYTMHELKPYFIGKFGGLNLSAKALIQTGDQDFTGGAPSQDLSGLAFNVEGSFNLGPVTLEAGYAFRSGDDKSTSLENEQYLLSGQDRVAKQTWSKFAILIDDENSGPYRTFGGRGTFTRNYNATKDGYKLIYGSAFFKPVRNLSVGLRVGHFTADEIYPKGSDEIGIETDFMVIYDIFKGLRYYGTVAWLKAGDYWKGPFASGGSPSSIEPEDNWATYQRLTLSF
ncbi:MAG: porin [Desulfobacterales bacterium]|nr:porin [Desulfobacterales bacterium]